MNFLEVCGFKPSDDLKTISVSRKHKASLMMPNSDPHDGFFYPHLVPMKDTYNLQSSLLLLSGLIPSQSDTKCIMLSLPRKNALLAMTLLLTGIFFKIRQFHCRF